uniref:Pathogenesis-related homeodomain protein n=2 Tax=Kalanchoe fedtschenkoi TaxID=63787 RepID=A0A7N0VG39_KALFE
MLPAEEDVVVADVSKRRRKRRRQGKKVASDDAARLQRRARYLLIKIKLEQNLIDAYAGEGWKGQSREKIRPEKELQRAYKQILKCKLGIRDAIRQLESLGSVGSMEDSLIAPDGSVHHEHIICAKCKLREAFPDNDIILCDGICNCAFHQKCLDPPLSTDNIPPEDQGWFCKFCQCRMDIIDVMNAHLGTHISMGSNWQDIFSEEASIVDGADDPPHIGEVQWPSDDSNDDDYDPEKKECSYSTGLMEAEDSSSLSRCDSVSISWSFEEEAFSDLQGSQHSGMPAVMNSACFQSCADSAGTMTDMTIEGCRQRRTVDYKKLYIEMFGKDAPGNEQLSEDEDWGPGKRIRKEKESYAASTLMTLFSCENIDPDDAVQAKEEHHQGAHSRRPLFRIPPVAVEKLRQVFAEDELPSKSVKDNLSKLLGLSPEKVNKWFKNARYLALRNRKMGSSIGCPNPIGTCSNESPLNEQCVENKVICGDTLNGGSSSSLVNASMIKQSGYRAQSLSNLRKKKRHRRTLLGLSSCNTTKVMMDFNENVSLKQQLQLLKSASKKRIWNHLDFKEGFNRRPTRVEMEMERLCTIKCRVDGMLENLSVLLKQKSGTPKAEAVVYVPIAEVKEKF